MKVELPFAQQQGDAGVQQNSRESLINMYAEVEPSGRQQLIRRQRPGLNQVLANAGAKRAIERHKGTHYCVIANKLYSFNGSALTELGTLSSSTGRCTIIFNDNDQVMVSDGTNAWFWNGSAFAAVTSPVSVGHLAYMNGYGIFNKPSSGSFYLTGSNDFSTVDALDFATAETNPDNLVRVFVDHNELWLFGAISTEVWQFTGATDFPLQKMGGAEIERGLMAAFSVVADDNSVFWLGDDGVFYRADGYRPVRISTHAIEHAVADIAKATREGADAFIHTVGGNKFYTIRFTDSLTLQYNIATGFWNRARTYNQNDWQVLGSAGHHADYVMTPAGICTLDRGLSTDEGGTMERGGVSAPLYSGGNRVSVRSFRLDAEVGGSGANSNVNLRVSRDGGETFQTALTRTLGTAADYEHRVVWRNLGQGRNWVFEVLMTDAREFNIMGVDTDIHVASS